MAYVAARPLKEIKDDAEALIRRVGRDHAPVDAGAVCKLLQLIDEAAGQGYNECVRELDEQGILY
jgi:hypothetical protein